MAITLKAYHDSALTQEITSSNPVFTAQLDDGTLPPVDRQIFIGSVAVGTKFRATSDPGIDSIMLTPTDTVPGSGLPTTSAKLALTQVALAAAVAGDPLDLGPQINSGVAGAVQVWVRQVDTTGVQGVYTDITFNTNSLDEDPV